MSADSVASTGPPPARPLRVAVVGAGPAGLYLADALTFETVGVVVDVIERLPVPFGLLRYGVAPDHPTIKRAARSLQAVLERPEVTLLCNVEIGTSVTVDELRERYDAVVWATGADADRRLDVAGEDLPGCTSATSFVRWYNGHPEAQDVDLAGVRTAVVVGAGNVALDVTRMLVKDVGELVDTDVPDHVLRALGARGVADVHLLARRGPEHAKFTTKELGELGRLADVDVIVDAAEIPAEAPEGSPAPVGRNLALLRDWAARGSTGAARRVHLHFGVRLEEVVGPDAVRSVTVRPGAPGEAGETWSIPADLVLRAVGYRSRPIVDVPFVADTATIPHVGHRVVRPGGEPVGEYAVGWAKRGPTGILGSNRADADDTARAVLADRDLLLARRPTSPVGVAPLLAARGVTYLDLAGWNAVVGHEASLGDRLGRPTVKIHGWDDLVAARHPLPVRIPQEEHA